ncbi:major tail tube protein FII [Pseudomonas aeruginosa]|nr:major tail tube protein FII [Pseudomonas aeruginosa]
MAMPRKLKNMNLFNDGGSYQGLVKSCTLPPLARKMEAFRGGGMNGPVKADLGHDDDGIQFEWTVGGLELTVLKQYGAVSASGVMLRFAGAYQQDDTGAVTSVEIVVRGRHETIEMGDAPARRRHRAQDHHHLQLLQARRQRRGSHRDRPAELRPRRSTARDLLEAQRKAIGL